MIKFTGLLIFLSYSLSFANESNDQKNEPRFESCKYEECATEESQEIADLASFASCIDKNSRGYCLEIARKLDLQIKSTISTRRQIRNQIVRPQINAKIDTDDLPVCQMAAQQYTNYTVYDPIAQGIPFYASNPPCVVQIIDLGPRQVQQHSWQLQHYQAQSQKLYPAYLFVR